MKKISFTLVMMMILTSIFGVVAFAEELPAVPIDELTIYKGATINSMEMAHKLKTPLNLLS